MKIALALEGLNYAILNTVEHEIHSCPMYSEFQSFAS